MIFFLTTFQKYDFKVHAYFSTFYLLEWPLPFVCGTYYSCFIHVVETDLAVSRLVTCEFFRGASFLILTAHYLVLAVLTNIFLFFLFYFFIYAHPTMSYIATLIMFNKQRLISNKFLRLVEIFRKIKWQNYYKGPSTYDIRFLGAIFDPPAYPCPNFCLI